MDNKTKNLTERNTKQEFIEAYGDAKKRIEELEKMKDNPQAVIEKKEKEKVIKQSDVIAEKNILNPEIIEEYNTLKKGIEIEKNEFEELTKIKVEANTLTSLFNAYKDKEVALDIEYKQKQTEEQQTFNEVKFALSKELDKLKLEKKEFEDALKKARIRDDEEYKYDLSRKKVKDDAEWKDIKTKREKELAEKEEVYKLKLKEITDKQAEFDKMKTEIEAFPIKLAEAKTEGATVKEKDLGRDYGYKKTMYEKESEYKVKGLDEKIARLEEDNQSLKAEKEALKVKLDEAYAKVQEIATQTVKSAGGVKILSNEKEK